MPTRGVIQDIDPKANGGYPNRMSSGPPTDEIGALTSWAPGLAGWSAYVGDDLERATELQWPQSVLTYQSMRNDSQVQGLYLGTTLPLRRYHWMLDDNECDPAMVKALAADLNLPQKSSEDPVPKMRSKNRFSFHRHMQDGLLALLFGHYAFEQVGEVRDDGLWHLTKLAPRPPSTISQIFVDNAGDLTGFQQFFSQSTGVTPVPIPVERSVWYAWMMEGANWPGRSMLRSCYRNWLRKDRLLRVDATKNERNGMGIPIAEGSPGMSAGALTRLDNLMRRLRGGDTAGGAIPAGASVKLVGTTGQTPDVIKSIQLDNEEMARAWLAMFMQLGQTETGSRALGSEFIDFFSDAVDMMGQWFADEFTQQVIEDWWDWNVDPDADSTPLLCYARNPDSAFVGRDIANLVRYGALTVDPDLENAIRDRVGLPHRDPDDNQPALPAPPGSVPWPPDPSYALPLTSGTEANSPPAPPSPAPTPTPTSASLTARSSERQRSRQVAMSSPVSLPARPLRRQLYAQEVKAAVDWASMDSSWELTRDHLVQQMRVNQQRQIDELHDAIIAAGNDLTKLSVIQATPNMDSLLQEAMQNMAIQGARDVQTEASRQGYSVELPDVSQLMSAQTDRAKVVDQMLARDLSTSAQNNAVRLASGGTIEAALSMSSLADKVKTKMQQLSDAYLKLKVGGALTAAMNSGRRATMANDKQPKQIYASEILDNNTCSPCADEDGTVFYSLSDAEDDYPSGGYTDCQGGDRCRGTLIAVYGESDVTLQ